MSTQRHRGRQARLMALAVFASAAALWSAGCAGPGLSGGEKRAERPNIVFIIADDLGWADVGYHGGEIRTPNIDRLAEGGVRLEHHYVLPTCTPTRVGLMTGRYPSRYGVTSPAYGQIFDKDTVTLPALLGAGGYHTSITGKWHMGSPPDCVPLRYGFTTSHGYFHGQIDPYTHLYKTGVRSWHRNDEFVDEEGHATDLITQEAVRVIETARDRPFFLYVAYSVPHFPLDEPDAWTSMYEGTIQEESRRWYAASVTHMDAGIGRIVDALDRTGKRKDTLVIFVSDNGGQRSWHSTSQYKGRYAQKPHRVLGNNLPLRGWKGELYEGGIRVPALASWPGVLEPGEVKAPIHIVDWMPTICRLAGVRPEKNLKGDGRDVWTAILERPDTSEPRRFYWKTPGASAVRQGDWKLITDRAGKRVELYNVAADPHEERNLSGEHPDRVRDLRALLEGIAKDDRGRSG